MKVLAIGASGFIGRPTVDRLLGAGHDVAIFHRNEAGASVPDGAEEIRGSRDRLFDFAAEFDAFAPDVVLDMILYTETQARELADLFCSQTERIVAISSADVYRNYDGLRGKTATPPDLGPLGVDAPLRDTRFPYRGHDLPSGQADEYEKILVEQTLLKESDLPATILRLPAVYGPGDRQHRLQPYVRRMADADSTILLEDRQARWRWTRGFVENVAAAVALATVDPRSAGRVYNLGDEPTLGEREWAERIGVAAGWRGEIVEVPAAELPDQLRQPLDWRYDLWTDTTAIRDQLGYAEPVSLDAALRETVAWERSEAP